MVWEGVWGVSGRTRLRIPHNAMPPVGPLRGRRQAPYVKAAAGARAPHMRMPPVGPLRGHSRATSITAAAGLRTTERALVKPLHMHGAPGYGRYQLGGLNVLAVRSCQVVRDTSWRPWRRESRRGGGVPEFLAGFGGPGGQSAAQEAGRNGATARAKRYAHCALEDMRAKSDGKHNIF